MHHQQRVCKMVVSWTVCKRGRLLQTLLSVGPRLLVQVALLAAFLYFFGFPAVARFAKKGVMVVETSKDTNGIPIPAITVSAMGQISGDTCFHRNASIEDCLEDNTLKKSDILKGNAILGMKRQKKINLTKELVTEDFTSTWDGRYYTLRLPFNIGPDDNQDQIFLGFIVEKNYFASWNCIVQNFPEYFSEFPEYFSEFPRVFFRIFLEYCLNHKIKLTEDLFVLVVCSIFPNIPQYFSEIFVVFFWIFWTFLTCGVFFQFCPTKRWEPGC